MTEQKRLWKSLKLKDGKIISDYDKSEWKVGKWRTVCVPKEECKGLNACENIIDAINYVFPDILAEVEIAGCCIKGDDKYTCERMRIVRCWKWEKEDSVSLAIFAARMCLKNYEDVFPDDRPRKAIEAAEAYQETPSKKNRAAAASAESAASAAWSAASAAKSAAWSAASAAKSATWSAASAAKSAAASAASAKKKIHNFLVKRFENRVEYQ